MKRFEVVYKDKVGGPLYIIVGLYPSKTHAKRFIRSQGYLPHRIKEMSQKWGL